MKRIALVVILGAFIGTGCTSSQVFFTDLGRDAADIFTATYGENIGAKARVGPIHAGLFAGRDIAGLRAGQLSSEFVGAPDIDAPILEIDLTVLSADSFLVTDLTIAQERGKLCVASGYIVAIEQSEIPWRQKIPYYTESDVAVGLFRGVRFGLNIGELLDFLLGFTTFDLFQDDIELRRQKSIKASCDVEPRRP